MKKFLTAIAGAAAIGAVLLAMPGAADAHRFIRWDPGHWAHPHWDHGFWGSGSVSHGGWGLGGPAGGAWSGGSLIAVTPYGPYPYGPFPHGLYP